MYSDYFKTPIGYLSLVANDKYLLSVTYGKEGVKNPNTITSMAKKELNEYLGGQRVKFTVPVKLDGTEFQIKAWKALQKIKYGKLKSYKDQALMLGSANYTRAVGGANNKNKLPIIVPCHRVVGSNGSLIGYAGGLNIKQKLLKLEGAI